jgi:hypothetical protein
MLFIITPMGHLQIHKQVVRGVFIMTGVNTIYSHSSSSSINNNSNNNNNNNNNINKNSNNNNNDILCYTRK